MPVHPKVKSATLAAAVSGVLVWALSRYLFHGLIPAGYVAEIDAAVPALLTFIAGWLTPSKKAAPPAPLAAAAEKIAPPPAGHP